MNTEKYYNHLQKLAYHFWLSDGQPDGELYIETFSGPMKIKDIHWIKAEIIANLDLDIMRYIEDTINI